MSAREAFWLKAFVQNSQSPPLEEPPYESQMRETLFNALPSFGDLSSAIDVESLALRGDDHDKGEEGHGTT